MGKENKNDTLEDRGLESDIGEPLNLNSTLGLGGWRRIKHRFRNRIST